MICARRTLDALLELPPRFLLDKLLFTTAVVRDNCSKNESCRAPTRPVSPIQGALYKIILTTSAVSSTNLGSILIFVRCVLYRSPASSKFHKSKLNRIWHCIMLPIIYPYDTLFSSHLVQLAVVVRVRAEIPRLHLVLAQEHALDVLHLFARGEKNVEK